MGNQMVTRPMTSRDPINGQDREPNTLKPNISKTSSYLQCNSRSLITR